MMENGSMLKSMEKEQISSLMEINIMGITEKANLMDVEFIHGRTVVHMMENSKMG